MAIFKFKDYDKNVDYTDEIKKAVERGDYDAAGDLERKRNNKIAGENLNYKKTYDYIDIGTDMQKAMKLGAPANTIKELMTARENKALSNDKYSPYYDDEIQRQASKYYYNSINGVGGNLENRPEFKDKYNSQIDKLVNEILNKKDFSFDLENDPSYQAYRESAIREGQKAMQNVLAEHSINAGGNNSYAVSAAAQAQNDYLSKLNDIVPTLYNDAYNRYLNELSMDKENLSTLLSMQDNDYNRYLSEYDVWDNDRIRANSEYKRDYAENRENINYNQAIVDMLVSKGQMPNETLLRAAGYTDYDAIKNIARNNKRAIDLGFSAQEQDLLASQLANEYKQKQINNYGGKRYTVDPDIDPEIDPETESDYASIDRQSMLSLGLGVLSEEKLEELVESGEVEAYEENGKIYVRWTNNRNSAGGF